MKKRSYAIEFIFILVFFVLPPLWARPASGEREAAYPLQTFLLAVLAALLVSATRARANDASCIRRATAPVAPRWSLVRLIPASAELLVAFGTLCCTASLVTLLAILLQRAPSPVLRAPHNALTWLNCICGTVAEVFYEEVLYRKYLPDAAIALLVTPRALQRPRAARLWRLLCEAGAIALFAAGHRYLGAFAVLNAAVAGAVLRRCYLRTQSLWVPCIAHCAYNAVMLAFSFLQA